MDTYKRIEKELKISFDSLQEIVDKISELLNCPVTVEDTNHRLLAYSKHEITTDSARIETIISKQVPAKVVQSLWKQGVFQQLNEQDEPVTIRGISDVGLGDRVAISIRQKDEVIGYIWALGIMDGKDSFSLEVMKEAAKIIRSYLIKLRLQQKKEEEGVQKFFWKTLTGGGGNDEKIVEALKQFQVPVPKEFAILVFRFSKSLSTEEKEQAMSYTRMLHEGRIDLSLFHENELIILLSSLEGVRGYNSYYNHFAKKVVNFFHEKYAPYQISVGIGNVYSNLCYIETSFKEALQVMELREHYPNELKDVLHYEQLGIFKYIDVIMVQQEKERRYSAPLTLLIEYDRKNQADLVDTLHAFLNADGNSNKAAKSLHVHPNTLNYRMKRVVEITGVDLSDINQKLDLYLQLKIMKLKSK